MQTKPTPDAIPILRRALGNEYHGVVRCAAASLQKLGTDAIVTMPDLLDAARKVDAATEMPQSYPDCLAAMVAIEPNNEEILPLITQFVGLHNWVPISASMKALVTIGTPEAIALLKRIHNFWYSEFDKTQKRVADGLLNSVTGSQ